MEQFYTFFGQLENSEFITVINTLANNAFKYQIILSDETISFITPTLYIINWSTHLQYNNTKFKGLLIDLNISTWSKGGIGQRKRLEQLDISVQLYKSIAGSTNFIFEIKNIASIRSVILNISMRFIKFCKMPSNSLFLLYLADIDKLGTFFNNITNQVIQMSLS